jgi:hypothetical protein
MSGARVRRVALAAAWLAPLLACSAQAPSARAPVSPAASAAIGGIERFMPLRDGFVLSYWLWLPDQQEPEQVIFQVERRSPSRASLRSGKSNRLIELTHRSVRLVTGGSLLEAPLTLGSEWSGALGRVRITAVDRSIEVSAGRFVGCLETTELGGHGQGDRAIVSTYCPDVGIAEIRVDDEAGQQRFELKWFGPRVDIDAM